MVLPTMNSPHARIFVDIRALGVKSNENTQATEAIRFREMGNWGQIIATFGGVDPHCLHCDWAGVAWI